MIYLQLFWEFFKIGLFTFGGGYAMIPMINQAMQSNGWLDLESVYNMIAVSEATPGPFAINIATYVGIETAGFFGAVVATLGVVIPSFFIILAVYYIFRNINNNIFFKNAMTAVKPVVVGLITLASVNILLNNIFNIEKLSDFVNIQSVDWVGIFMVVWLFIITRFKKINPILLIVFSAFLGLGLYSLTDYLGVFTV